jgi:GT2 family glycosyltransferase
VRAEDLTVVIPTRERWPILTRTLGALAQQTVGGFDIVVVCDGEDQRPPDALRAAHPDAQFLIQPQGGPAAARNHGVAATARPLLLFLGDDMVPVDALVARHLERHAREPEPRVAVLGDVFWHPEVDRGPLMHWLGFSDAQFDFPALRATRPADAGWGRFYSCNVSLKRSLLDAAGGFDPEFRFDYEDLDLAYRLHEQGMVLRWEPQAIAHHLHRYDLRSLEARYRSRAAGERLMAAKHPWFEPWFERRMRHHTTQPPVGPWWGWLALWAPSRPQRVRQAAERRADRLYHQRLAPTFLAAWEAEREHAELRAYLGSEYDHQRLVHHRETVERQLTEIGDEPAFYRRGDAYLYDLTAFAMSGVKEPYRALIEGLVPAGSRLLDYGCGIGSDGLRLLEAGFTVEFADFDSPSTQYLRWRLEQRGVAAPIYDLDADIPGGFALAYAFDVLEHVDDPFALLAELEERAEIVVVNLLEDAASGSALHRDVPVRRILAHARRQGLVHHRRHAGSSHLVAYRSAGGPRNSGGSSPGGPKYSMIRAGTPPATQ